MPRAMWSGSISFGLVNIPVKLYLAVKEQRVQFRMLHDQDHSRLQRKLVSSTTGKEVHSEHIVKGFEVSPDQFVVVQDRELEDLVPKASRTIEIHDFVDIEQIDPIYYDRAYYLAPAEHAAKPYRLLMQAMKKSQKVAVATFVMREREYLSALRTVKDIIGLSTMHYHDEVLEPDEIDLEAPDAKIDERELKMAQSLIDSLSGEFDPSKYTDTYRARVMEMVQRKAKGEEVVTQPPVAEKPSRAVNLMAALEASLAEARKQTRRRPVAAGARRRRSA